MQCHLLIPALFPPATQTPENDPLNRVAVPALRTLLARGTASRSEPSDLEAWLCQAFGVARQQDFPVAPFALLADGLQAGEAYWLCADPVHLSIERDQLILTESSTFSLSQAESDNLISALNNHFSHDGLHFFAPHPMRWYLRLDTPPAMATQTLMQTAGHNIHPRLPRGQDELRWRALINEVQMLLFEHPVNVAREHRGEAPINSVWPWGGGIFSAPPGGEFDHMWSDHALATGLAMASMSPYYALSANAREWLERAQPGNHLVVLDSLRPASLYGTPHAWRERLEALEHDWFAPLERALRKGATDLTLHAPTAAGTLRFDVSRGSLWKLWRRLRPLMDYRPRP